MSPLLQDRLILLKRPSFSKGHLDVTPQDRQGRLDLVAGIGQEAPLVLERLVDPGQHDVEHRNQPPDLVRVRVCADPVSGGVHVHRLGLPYDLHDGPHGLACEPPAQGPGRDRADQDQESERPKDVIQHGLRLPQGGRHLQEVVAVL
jgi:hypothetical protein